MRSLKTLLLVILIAGLGGGLAVLGQVGCGTSAPPAPIAEIPSLVFPSSTSVDVGELEMTSGGAGLKAHVAAGGTYSPFIDLGFQITDGANNLNDTALSAIAGIAVSTTDGVTSFDSARDDPSFDRNPVKIDFGDFSFSGKTTTCSGCTCPYGCTGTCTVSGTAKPICYRIWIDSGSGYERFMAGYFDEIPNDENGNQVIDEGESPGAGAYRIFTAAIAATEEYPIPPADRYLGVLYDHTDATDDLAKFTDLSIVAEVSEVDEETGDPIPGDPTQTDRVHVVVDQASAFSSADEDDETRKTLLINSQSEDAGGEYLDGTSVEYLSQYRHDQHYWLGTILGEQGADILFSNVCVDMFTGEEASDPDACSDVGLSIAGFAIDPPATEDVTLPDTSEFPTNACTSPNLGTSTGC